MIASSTIKENGIHHKDQRSQSLANQANDSIVREVAGAAKMGIKVALDDSRMDEDGSVSPSSSIVSVVSTQAADYAPSPNTCNQALARANQLRVQSMLRQLLSSEDDQRLSLLRLLRKLLRQLDYKVGWLAQVDLLETIERIFRDETCKTSDSTWRVLNDSTQLLTEALPRLPVEPDWVSLEPILGLVVENLGNARSELRRSSLLLINFLVNHYNDTECNSAKNERKFQQLLQLFIDRGLTNCHNEQAQKGAILSLPLIMSRHTVEGHDLLCLVRALADLLVGAQSKLFYSLFLCLQRLHQTLGERRFMSYLNECQPEAKLLYKQAASRNNSLVSNATSTPRESVISLQAGDKRVEESTKNQGSLGDQNQGIITSNRQVTFEDSELSDYVCSTNATSRHADRMAENKSVAKDCESPPYKQANQTIDDAHDQPINCSANRVNEDCEEPGSISPIDSLELGGSTCSDDQQIYCHRGSGNQDQFARCQDRAHIISADLMSDVSSTCSSEANLVNPAHYMNQAALNGHPLDGLVDKQIHTLYGGSGQLSSVYKSSQYVSTCDGLAINTMGVCCSPTVDMGGPQSIELKFGIFPKHLIQVSLSPSTGRHHQQDRLEALNEMMCIIRESPINHLAILTSYLEPFIEQFLARLLEANGDYQCGLVAIDMIETIVIKTKLSTLQYVRPMVQLLVRALADTRSFYRENTVRVIHKMMAYLPPQHVIDALFEHKHHRSALVREQLIDRITGAILTYDRKEFNLTKLCYHVLPLLADHNSCVRLAAIECIASLAHALGPDRIGTLLTAAEAVQTGCDYDGLLDAIQARLMRRTLPRCNQDGSIKHVIRPFLSQAQAHLHQEHRAADVRWVKEAPSSHQHLHNHDHVTGGGEVGQTPDQSQHIVHAHRPGVYSPTIGVEMSHIRRASIAPVEIGETTNYHRNYHTKDINNNNDDKRAKCSDLNDNIDADGSSDFVNKVDQCNESTLSNSREVESRDDPTDILNDRTKGVLSSENGVKKKTGNRRKSIDDKRLGNYPENESGENSSLLNQATPTDSYIRFENDKSKSKDNLKSNQTRCIYKTDSRSGSSDSNNSSKFRQSLSGPNGVLSNSMSVLPSDAIIYSDTVQAYELSRRRSRQQQTSFDYESDSVGQIPIASTTYKTTRSETKRLTTNAMSSASNEEKNNLTVSSNKKPLARKSSGGPNDNQDEPNASQQLSRENRNSVDQDQSGNSPILSSRKRSMNNEDQKSIAIEPGEETAETIKPQTTSTRRSSQRQISRLNSMALESNQDYDDSDDGIAKKNEKIEEHENRRRPSIASLIANEERKLSNHEYSDGAYQAVENTLVRSDVLANTNQNDAPNLISDEQHQSSSSATSRKSDRQSRCREQRSKQQHRVLDDINTPLSENDSKELIKQRQAKSQPPDRNRHTPTSNTPTRNQQQLQHQKQSQSQSKKLSQKSSIRSTFSDNLDGSDSTSSSTARGHGELGVGGRRAISVSPGSISGSMNILQILETVAENEGQFQEPMLAMRVALDALGSNCWSTKVEGILAIIRLAAHHPQIMMSRQHEIVTRVAHETTNLRSTVSRAAIFALGDFSAKLGRSVEPELDCIVQALLSKACENTAFIRDDIRRSFSVMVDHVTQWKLATSLIIHGASHKNLHARRIASQFIAALVQRMGAAKCLAGARDISSLLLPAAAKMTQDSSPHTRYHGRLILASLLQHGSFDRLMRKYVTPSLYRSCLGIVEGIKRRGPGEPPGEF